ncbi:MAG TPA: flagellar biosynthetic protein FliO [Polyangiaceae bacterium]|nr:flagellar biosynthetic protein FliO [Polyangiaceae bacterium]
MTPRRQAVYVTFGAALIGAALSSASVLAQPWRDPPPPAPSATTAPVEAPAPAPKAAAPASSAPRSYLRQQAATKKPVASAESPSALRVALMGGLVAGLGVWALLKKRKKQTDLRATRSDLEVLSSARVGSKAQVVVINVGGRKVLLGVTESEVNRLAWLDGELDGDGATTEPFDDAEPFVPAPERKLAPSPTPNKVARVEPRRFRDALLGALGQPQKAPAANGADAALAIAESTQDVVTRSPRVAVPAEAPESMVDVEGQAKGLVLRLQKRA